MRRSTRTRSRLVASIVIVQLALVAGFVFAGTGRGEGPPSEARDQAARAAAVRIVLDPHVAEVPPAEASTPEPPPTPQPLLADAEEIRLSEYATRIRIPSVGIDADVRTVGYVFQDGRLQYDVPRRGAGQYVGTAAPGEAGNAVIAGHVSTRSGPAVFRELPNVSIGDTIEVLRGDEMYRYVITEVRVVEPSETSVMSPTSDSRLTLITCAPDQQATQRYVVIGKLV